MSTSSTDYLLVLRETTPERYEGMTRGELREALLDWNTWIDGLVAAGSLRLGSPLEPDARIVPERGSSRAVDGPFAEAKELIGGYLVVTAGSLDEATAIAEGAPNIRYGMSVEVRPLANRCHLARSLGWPTMRESETEPTPAPVEAT
jgi:hypothetical protein